MESELFRVRVTVAPIPFPYALGAFRIVNRTISRYLADLEIKISDMVCAGYSRVELIDNLDGKADLRLGE